MSTLEVEFRVKFNYFWTSRDHRDRHCVVSNHAGELPFLSMLNPANANRSSSRKAHISHEYPPDLQSAVREKFLKLFAKAG